MISAKTARPLLQRPWAGILLLGVALFLVRSWEGILLEDPVRYAAVSKSILETGDWITMHESPSRLYFNKPPLYFWMTAFLFKAFGVSTWAARFWSAASGIGCMLLLYDILRRYAGERTGMWAAVALGLSNDFLSYTSVGRLDGPQVLFMALAAWGFARVDSGRQRFMALVPGVACGLGLLLKGPPVLAMLPVILCAGVLQRLRRGRRHVTSRPVLALFLAGILLGLLAAAPWHLAVAEANPGFWAHYVGREMADRAAGELVAGKSRLHFVNVLLVHGLPWTVFAVAGLWRLAVRLKTPPPAALHSGNTPGAAHLLAPWLLAMLAIAFALPRMYGRYLVMAWPPLAACAALGVVGVVEYAKKRESAVRGRHGAGRIFLRFGRLVSRCSRELEKRLWLYALLLGLAILFAPVPRHQEGDEIPIRRIAEEVSARLRPGETLPLYLVQENIHAPEAMLYFYSDREARQMTSLNETLAQPAPLVLTSPGGFAHLKEHGYVITVRGEKAVLARKPVRVDGAQDRAGPPAP